MSHTEGQKLIPKRFPSVARLQNEIKKAESIGKGSVLEKIRKEEEKYHEAIVKELEALGHVGWTTEDVGDICTAIERVKKKLGVS